MTTYRYTLEPYKGIKSRYQCPECLSSQKTFTRYIDTETNSHVADNVGRCSREEKCGYHYKPNQYFKAKPEARNARQQINSSIQPDNNRFDTIPELIMLSTLRGYHNNTFTLFLAGMLGAAAAINLIEKYKIGTAKHWPGATIFWQIDVNNRIRTGKVMLYDKSNCKRVKAPYNHIAWVHRLLSSESKVGSLKSRGIIDSGLPTQGFELRQCFFGEHLLPLDPFKTVAITESEKTAVIASYYYPNYIWLAAGSLEGLSISKCKVLKNRTVMLFPDVNGYAKWHAKALELTHFIRSSIFRVDYTLFKEASPYDREQGVDIADKWIDDWLGKEGERGCHAEALEA